MTEKRFKIINFLITENGFALTNEQATDRLNELFDENEQLKQELSIREDQIQQITVAAYTDQYKEAEKYRKKFIRVCDELAEDEITIGNLKKENEKLKEENKGIQNKVWRLLNLLEEENGIDKRKIIDWWNSDIND